MGNNTQQEGSLQELQPSKQPQPQVVVTPPSAIHQADPGAPAKTAPGQPKYVYLLIFRPNYIILTDFEPSFL